LTVSGFFHPLWLIALAIIPLIRWLHRWRAPLSSWPVSAVFLWEPSNADEPAGKRKGEPEPAWRRRALAAALLIVALAGPYRSTGTRALSIWIDDSLSAFATENGSPRIATMFESLTAALDENDTAWSQITLRSLTNPGQAHPYVSPDSLDPVDWQGGAEKNLDDLAMPILAAGNDHWLLTDGASGEIRAWAARVSLNRVIQSGTATENTAVTRLAARRNIAYADRFNVLVSISNTGVETDERQVTLYSGKDPLQITQLSLAPGQTTHWQVQATTTNETLTASISPGDSLVDDDGLTISLARFKPLATHVDPDCGPALRRALSTHRSLVIANSISEAALIVSCSQDDFSEGGKSVARIRALRGAVQPVSSSPAWFTHSGPGINLGLALDWISAAQWPEQASVDSGRVLLATTEQPLVVVHAHRSGSATTVDTVVDLNQARFIRQPEYAAFIATLVDLATGRMLLDEVATIARDPRHSVIAPESLETRDRAAKPVDRATSKPLSTQFLAAALLLLLFDAVLLLRARTGASHV